MVWIGFLKIALDRVSEFGRKPLYILTATQIAILEYNVDIAAELPGGCFP